MSDAWKELRDAVLSAPDCGDSLCHFAMQRGGMRTNGGCRCLESPRGRGEVKLWAQRLRAALLAEVTRLREPVVAEKTHFGWRVYRCASCLGIFEENTYGGPLTHCPHCGRPISEWRRYKSEEAPDGK